MMEKALKVVSVELREELIWESERDFLGALWSEIRYELLRLRAGKVAWSLKMFIERIHQELERRNRDIRKFRNERGEPITNMFKGIIREVARDSGIPLTNDALSRLLNYIRNQYTTAGVLTGALYPVEAFFQRSEYGIPEDLGDDDSCFRPGGCNEGNALWLIAEDKKYDRAKLVVFHYQSGSKEGWGRCWVYRVSDWAIFATNFYSRGFEVKSNWLRYPVVRVIRLLFDLSENVKFACDKNIDLPIYLNGDGLIIYEAVKYNSSDEVIKEAVGIQSECMECGDSFRIIDLCRSDTAWYYDGETVKGLIVCEDCKYKIEHSTFCAGCDELCSIDDMYIYDDEYYCPDCFHERFEYCFHCRQYYLRDNMIVDRYENWLCPDCAAEHRVLCEECNEFVYPEDAHIYEVLTYCGIVEEYICDKCAEDLRKIKCEQCGYEFYYREDQEIREIDSAGLCPECYRNKILMELCDGSCENTVKD